MSTLYRMPIGRLNGITPEVGTILGPDTIGQWFVVLACDDAGCDVGFATEPDIAAAAEREPWSVAEHLVRRAAK